MSHPTSIEAVQSWVENPSPTVFPYHAVVNDFLAVGKHFVDERLLKALDIARSVAAPGTQLHTFLDVALDKYDGRYYYLSYTAVSLLRHPVDHPPERALAVRDRQLACLLHDLLSFELASMTDVELPLPGMPASESTIDKRCHLALRVLAPVLERLGYPPAPRRDNIAAARATCAYLNTTLEPDERLILKLSMLPVYTLHDEYLFLRVLQSFETNFSLVAANMTAVIELLGQPVVDIKGVCTRLTDSATLMRESAPLFSLLATMQVDAFRTFRAYTEGASAIQSEAYKTVESLCRRPDDERLNSLAYTSVPKIRDAMLRDQDTPTVWGRYQEVRATGRLTDEETDAIDTAMAELQAAHRRWRTTHYRLAVRMLGDAGGSGFSEGTPYLRSVIDNELLSPHETPDGG